MKVAVIGGTGFLGSQIVRELTSQEIDTISTHHRNPNCCSIRYDFFRDDPAVIFPSDIDIFIIAAKLEMGTSSNMLGPAMERFARFCLERSARLVYESSDGIFSGQKGNYAEWERPDPVTEYGRNLLICEDIIRELPDFCIIRPSYLYGYSGKRLDGRLNKFVDMILGDNWTPPFSDMYKSPLHVFEAAGKTTELALSDYKGVIHVAGPKMSVFDFAREGLIGLGFKSEAKKVFGVPMSKTGKYLPDTSLDSHFAESFLGYKPLGIFDALKRYRPAS